MENAVIICVIVLSAIIACVLVLLGILFYNQMLVTNEINKRLLLIAKESIDKERSSQEELQQTLIELDRVVNEQNNKVPLDENNTDQEIEEPFNPHTYSEDYKEN
jgi:hypothetical protein